MLAKHHIMRNDPRRIFVFGFTIEDTEARIWYHDRAVVISSDPFDINKVCSYNSTVMLYLDLFISHIGLAQIDAIFSLDRDCNTSTTWLR